MTDEHRATHRTRFQVSSSQASSPPREFLIPQSSWLPSQVGCNMAPVTYNLQHKEGWSRLSKKEKSNYDVRTPVGQPTEAQDHLCPIRVVSKWIKRTQPVCTHNDQSMTMGCFQDCWGKVLLSWGKPCRTDCWADCWLTLQLGVLPWRDIWAE